MNWGSPEFVIFIVGITTGGWVINNWIRARHGYALEDEWGGKTHRAAESKVLEDENVRLREELGGMEQRMRVLERIVTDKGHTVAAEIEALRDGVLSEERR